MEFYAGEFERATEKLNQHFGLVGKWHMEQKCDNRLFYL